MSYEFRRCHKAASRFSPRTSGRSSWSKRSRSPRSAYRRVSCRVRDSIASSIRPSGLRTAVGLAAAARLLRRAVGPPSLGLALPARLGTASSLLSRKMPRIGDQLLGIIELADNAASRPARPRSVRPPSSRLRRRPASRFSALPRPIRDFARRVTWPGNVGQRSSHSARCFRAAGNAFWRAVPTLGTTRRVTRLPRSSGCRTRFVRRAWRAIPPSRRAGNRSASGTGARHRTPRTTQQAMTPSWGTTGYVHSSFPRRLTAGALHVRHRRRDMPSPSQTETPPGADLDRRQGASARIILGLPDVRKKEDARADACRW